MSDDKEKLTPAAIRKARGTKRRGVAKGRHLTAAQKAEIAALWRSGEMTLENLAKRFEKDVSTIKTVVKGIKKGEYAEEIRKKVIEEVEKTIVDDSTIYAQRVKETKEEHYKMATALAKLTYATVAAAKRDARPLSTITGDVKTLQIAAQTLKITREERYAVLGMSVTDDDADKPLPDLVIQELTQEDIQELHRQQMVSEDEFGDEDMLASIESDIVEAEAEELQEEDDEEEETQD